MKIDLDAARAARREASGEPAPTIFFSEKEFTLPLEIPFEVAERMGKMGAAAESNNNLEVADGFRDVLRLLLGEQFDEFMSFRPSAQDLMALVDGVVKAYGFADAGESQASATSS